MPQIVIDATGPTKGSLVEGGYDFCGLSGDQFERTPEEMTKGLRFLNALMASLRSNKGVDLGFVFPNYGEGLLAEPSGIPDGAREPICALLAQRLAPSIGATLSDDARAVLSNAYQDLLAATAPAPPARAGAYRMPRRRRLFGGCLTLGLGSSEPTPAPSLPPSDPTPDPGDTTAPILTSPIGTQTGQTTATVGATTDEANGTLYYVITASSTAPSAAQVEAGQDASGASAIKSGSQAISSAGAKTFSVISLTAATTYYAFLMHKDAAGNRSNVASSGAFTTVAAPISAPVNTGAPTITGTTGASGVLTLSDLGTFTNSPTGYTQQWKRDGVAISGATGTNYTKGPADVGAIITCAVTASNAGGDSDPATSNAIGPIAPPVLNDLLLSQTSFTTGTASTGSIQGTYPGSTLTATGLPPGLTINSDRTFTYDGSGTPVSTSISITETYGTASHTTVIAIVVADPSGIHAPTIARVSAAGSSPVTWSVTGDSTLPIGAYAELQVIYGIANATSTQFDAGLSGSGGISAFKTYSVIMTGADWSAGDSSIPYEQNWLEPTGAYSWRARFNTDPYDPDASIVSAWSAILGDTISGATTIWTNSTGVDRNAAITPSGSPLLTATGAAGRGQYNYIRATAQSPNAQNVVEVTINTLDTGVVLGMDDGTLDFSTFGSTLPSGAIDSHGFAINVWSTGSTIEFKVNSDGSGSGNITPTTTIVSGDTIQIARDRTAGTVKLFHIPAANPSGAYQLGGTRSCAALASERLIFGCRNAESVTANFGQNPFKRTPDAGYLPHN